MKIKSFYESKVFWVNLLAALVMAADLLAQQPFLPPDYLPWLVFAVGLVNIVLRVWFTDSGIASVGVARILKVK